MELNTYITFNDQCEAAFRFYERVLGGKITAMLTHAGTPAAQHVPQDWQDKIMHARLQLGTDLSWAVTCHLPTLSQPRAFTCRLGSTIPPKRIASIAP